jgi:hypothetical protein
MLVRSRKDRCFRRERHRERNQYAAFEYRSVECLQWGHGWQMFGGGEGQLCVDCSPSCIAWKSAAVGGKRPSQPVVPFTPVRLNEGSYPLSRDGALLPLVLSPYARRVLACCRPGSDRLAPPLQPSDPLMAGNTLCHATTLDGTRSGCRHRAQRDGVTAKANAALIGLLS